MAILFRLVPQVARSAMTSEQHKQALIEGGSSRQSQVDSLRQGLPDHRLRRTVTRLTRRKAHEADP